jgi:hypothetical protein
MTIRRGARDKSFFAHFREVVFRHSSLGTVGGTLLGRIFFLHCGRHTELNTDPSPIDPAT